MEKARYNHICNLECKARSPKRRGTGQCIKWERIRIAAIIGSK